MTTSGRTTRAAGLALLIALAACGGDARDDFPDAAGRDYTAVDPAEQSYAPQLGVDVQRMQRSPSGLYTLDTREGMGQPAQPGDRVSVHYTGWLPDGREFDSSRGGDPFVFTLGQGEVIHGWDEGVAGMRPGGQRRLVIPSPLAYGEQGAGGVIPPNANLVFDVELLEIR
jgi:FKBP-type peptidyl-prolyl cis-trans isomerase FkpA